VPNRCATVVQNGRLIELSRFEFHEDFVGPAKLIKRSEAWVSFRCSRTAVLRAQRSEAAFDRSNSSSHSRYAKTIAQSLYRRIEPSAPAANKSMANSVTYSEEKVKRFVSSAAQVRPVLEPADIAGLWTVVNDGGRSSMRSEARCF
jgi:hypothetical protein